MRKKGKKTSFRDFDKLLSLPIGQSKSEKFIRKQPSAHESQFNQILMQKLNKKFKQIQSIMAQNVYYS